MVTDILSRNVSELSQLIVQILDTVFEPPPPLRGLSTTYDIHLGLIGKGIVDFLLVLIKVISLRVTAESLGAKEIENRRFRSNVELLRFFQVEGIAPPPSIILHG